MKIDFKSFRDRFFREAAGHVRQMQADLLALAEGEADPELLRAVWLAAQSIQATARTFGLMETAEFAQAMGRCVAEADQIRVDLLLEAVDALAALLDAARRGTAAPGNCGALRSRLNAARKCAPRDPASPMELRRIDAEVFLQGVNPEFVVRTLNQLAAN
jgi:chemotaxis protein histidine kinase CheA